MNTNIEILKNILSNNFISTLVGTIAGSITGGLLVLFFDYRRKNKENIHENFNSSISIQLALHQMLSVLLYMLMEHNNCKNNTLQLYKQLNYNDIGKIWIKFRHIDLRKFYNTYLYINLNWNLEQFLSDKTEPKRNLLWHLIDARAIYQHINILLEIRNPLFDKASKLLSTCKINNQKLASSMYDDENLLKILPVKLYAELQSVTEEYIKSLPNGIHTTYDAFNQISEFIRNEFSNSQPLKLNLTKELSNLLKEINNSYLFL